MDILEKLKLIRNNMQISRNEVAKKLSVSPSLINEIESGRSKLSLNFFLELCEIYNISPLELLKNDKNNYIILSNQDLKKLNDANDVINKINNQTKKIQNFNITDNHGNISFGDGDNIINNYKKRED